MIQPPAPRKSYLGRALYRSLTNKKRNVEPGAVEFRQWLSVLLQSEAAADTLIKEFGADIEAMQDCPVPLLASLPNVGEACAMKLMAAFKLFGSRTIVDETLLGESVPSVGG